MRATVKRTTITNVANRMIGHLSDDGTAEATVKREAIIAVVSTILLEGNAYAGYRYTGERIPYMTAEGWQGFNYDETRIAYY